MPGLDPLFTLDPARDPAPFVADLRERDPVHWIPGLDAWFVTRHADVRQLFADPRLTSDPRGYDRYLPPADGPGRHWLDAFPFLTNSAEQQAWGRRLGAAALSPRAVADMRHLLAAVVEEYAAPLRKREGVADLLGEFCTPIPAVAIGRILGVPPKGEDERRFRELARRMMRGINPLLSEKKRRQTEQATIELCEYLLGLVRDRAERPRLDLLSRMVEASGARDEAGFCEVVRVVSGLVSAGTETAVMAGARGILALLRHRDQLRLLREEPELLPEAISELLRFDNGLVGIPRYVVEELELRDRRMKPGQLVVLSFLGAHRDPRVFRAPDRLDLRRDNRELLSFGYGPHFCLGANLARSELQLMLQAFLELPRDARLVEEQLRWGSRGLLSRLKTLPVELGG